MVNTDYSDIINKSRQDSLRHRKMSNYERAAQFSPFAALTGYEDAVSEVARLTDSKIELEEDDINRLNEQFIFMRTALDKRTKGLSGEDCSVTVKYFVKDELKEGGHYEEYSGIVRTIDDYDRILIMQDGKTIRVEDILSVEII